MFSEPFQPKILVAMPTLKDAYFERSVILLCEYNEEGAMGFVLNSPSTTSVDDLLGELGLHSLPAQHQPIHIGGPVQPELCWVVHTRDYEGESTTALNDDLALSAAQEVLSSVAEGKVPRRYVLGVGYSGWGAGQLDREIEENAWWLADIDVMSILDVDAERRWDMVAQRLGLLNCSATICRTA